MQEYWVNVYEKVIFDYHDKELAYLESFLKSPYRGKCLYRIRVKLDGGYNKRSPKYELLSDFRLYVLT